MALWRGVTSRLHRPRYPLYTLPVLHCSTMSLKSPFLWYSRCRHAVARPTLRAYSEYTSSLGIHSSSSGPTHVSFPHVCKSASSPSRRSLCRPASAGIMPKIRRSLRTVSTSSSGAWYAASQLARTSRYRSSVARNSSTTGRLSFFFCCGFEAGPGVAPAPCGTRKGHAGLPLHVWQRRRFRHIPQLFLSQSLHLTTSGASGRRQHAHGISSPPYLYPPGRRAGGKDGSGRPDGAVVNKVGGTTWSAGAPPPGTASTSLLVPRPCTLVRRGLGRCTSPRDVRSTMGVGGRASATESDCRRPPRPGGNGGGLPRRTSRPVAPLPSSSVDCSSSRGRGGGGPLLLSPSIMDQPGRPNQNVRK
mmetsp:Transcript_2327/g.6468  ORF Transcript_2327/g.6468 Transcript_2327/m.6468 type:complete len:360 (-) Transcript_2327:84-1163(-)